MLVSAEEAFFTAIAIIFVAKISWFIKNFGKVEDGSMDAETSSFLKDTAAVPRGQCEAMVNALEGAAFTEVEAECAEQMRRIVSASHISYSTLIESPETLLRCSLGHAKNGALWTRFTVQFNLFAGSIVSLGSDEQRQKLIETQSAGVLGCFAFTEKGAGVLSGAGVETTATFDPASDSFVIESPSNSSEKTWISQGLYAEQAVILAELIVDGDSKGPHLFWADIAERPKGAAAAAGGGGNSVGGGWFNIGGSEESTTTSGGGGGSGKAGAGAGVGALPRLERPVPKPGVTVEPLPPKTALKGLDNAFVSFRNFRVPRSSLLSRFCELGQLEPKASSTTPSTSSSSSSSTSSSSSGPGDGDGGGPVQQGSQEEEEEGGGGYRYFTKFPPALGPRARMVDLLVFRLLTGRIVLSEATVAHALHRVRLNFEYCASRKLWQGKGAKARGEAVKTMGNMPLVKAAFRDYGRSCGVLAAFIAHTRESVAECIRRDAFTHDVVEATCMCKFLGTGFGVDTVSAVRKVMGARALQEGAMLDKESFLPNACCAAEGDNTIMELKVVSDVVRGRTAKLPLALMWRVCGDPQGRRAVGAYLAKLGHALWLGRKAMQCGQLLKDLAWARAHMRVVDVWLLEKARRTGGGGAGGGRGDAWLESYDRILMNFPAPLTC